MLSKQAWSSWTKLLLGFFKILQSVYSNTLLNTYIWDSRSHLGIVNSIHVFVKFYNNYFLWMIVSEICCSLQAWCCAQPSSHWKYTELKISLKVSTVLSNVLFPVGCNYEPVGRCMCGQNWHTAAYRLCKVSKDC